MDENTINYMPSVEFSFQELVSLLGREYKPENLRNEISMLGVDLEHIDTEKISLEVFPNRPDLLSVEGFARALKGKLGLETGFSEIHLKDSGIQLRVDPSVSSVRPYVTSAVVRNLCFDEGKLVSLMDLQEKLHITHGRKRKKVAIGVHDLSKVVPPFLYKAVKPTEISFVPLDMSERMNLQQILRDHPKGVDYAWTLESCDRYPIIVDRNNDVLSFPPIINGELTRVTYDTTDLFIDVTGMDENAINQALNILVYALADMGGAIYSVDIKTLSTRG